MPIKVYYDGGCGLCNTEIRHYQRQDKTKAFEWVDISRHHDALESYKICLQDAMRHLHVQDEQGHWHIGVDGFIVIWKHLPAWRWAATLASFPPLKKLLSVTYTIFADRRFKKRSVCLIHEHPSRPETEKLSRG
jgi:predicted DCC family thiol-disulfide oxidoreductase YuxK